MAVQVSSGVSRIMGNAGVPSAGVDEVQTLTFGGTPDGGTFRLNFDGHVTADIAWDVVNNTLRDNVDAALEALGNIGESNVTTAVGTMTDGIGTLTCTFVVALGKLNVPQMTVNNNSMTGTAPTLVVSTTTAGVTATARGYSKGKLVCDTTNGIIYINTGTPAAPTWTKVGLQS